MNMNSFDRSPRYSRRRFLRAAATAGAAAWLTPGLLSAPGSSSERKVRIGIVGGRFGLGF